MLFDKISAGLEAATHYSGMRHKIIANNIANADTPGYKALDISFREQIRDFMNGQKRGLTSSALLPPATMFAPDMYNSNPRIDRNTVSIDQELTKLSQNAIFHNTCLQLLNSKYRILKSAISSGA